MKGKTKIEIMSKISLNEQKSINKSPIEEEILRVENLRTYYFKTEGIVKAVDDVSFIIPKGKIVAIVGESGCGKTATALSIVNLIPNPPGKIVDGKVWFESKDLVALSEEEIRTIRGKDIGMVFQEPSVALNPVLTIGVQLTEGMIEHLKLPKSEAIKRACTLLDSVGIPNPKNWLSQYPFQMSGGMRQRLMIAIALSCNPKLIIADEPTTALDVTIQAQVLDLMKNISDESKVSILIITHNLGIVARYSDYVNVMYAGRIIERGTTDEVFLTPRHPYTKGLLGSIPRLDIPKADVLYAIDGQPPDLDSLDLGCRFRDRCKVRDERCKEKYPDEIQLSNTHIASCWRIPTGE